LRHDLALVALFVFPGSLVLMLAMWFALRRAKSEQAALVHCHEEEMKRTAAERQLGQLQKFEALSQLTGGLAHDFNNLLHIVASNTALLAMMPPEADRQPYVSAINKVVLNGRALVKHLLGFARNKKLALECVEPIKVIPLMCELARHTLPGGTRLECSVDEDAWRVNVNCAELELAIINTTVNARDAMPDGGLITVRVQNAPRDSRRV
jgi:two-component system NtrC family sensor kinase